jgi:hypothetical protein
MSTLSAHALIWRGLSPEAKKRAREAFKRLHNYDLRWPANGGYCKHGGYVGDPYGPDYMCGTCEAGISALELALNAAKDFERAKCAEFFKLLADFTFNTFIDYIDYFSTEERQYLIPMLIHQLQQETEKL